MQTAKRTCAGNQKITIQFTVFTLYNFKMKSVHGGGWGGERKKEEKKKGHIKLTEGNKM